MIMIMMMMDILRCKRGMNRCIEEQKLFITQKKLNKQDIFKVVTGSNGVKYRLPKPNENKARARKSSR